MKSALPWTDTSFEFPESITWADLPQEYPLAIAGDVNSIDWARLSDEYNFSTFSMWGSDTVTPNDSIQGLLGDCWLVSSASSIAEDPERLKDIFKVQETNEVGIYAFKMYNLGMPVTVTIDDNLPF